MTTNDAYLYYEAGQVVAAAHLGLTIRYASGEAVRASDIAIPRDEPRTLMILLLTGMAAERRGLGQSDPLRRMRNRARMRRTLDSTVAAMKGSLPKRTKEGRRMLSQAQDQANNLVATLFDAIEQVAQRLKVSPTLAGEEVVAIVRAVKTKRRLKNQKARSATPARKSPASTKRTSDKPRKRAPK